MAWAYDLDAAVDVWNEGAAPVVAVNTCPVVPFEIKLVALDPI